MPSETARLDAEMIALHGSGQNSQLCALHELAAQLLGSTNAQRFHLTHAWIYALVAGDTDRINALETRLKGLGSL